MLNFTPFDHCETKIEQTVLTAVRVKVKEICSIAVLKETLKPLKTFASEKISVRQTIGRPTR